MFLSKMVTRRGLGPTPKSGDPFFDFHCLEITVKRSTFAGEPTPLFILDKLFSASVPKLFPNHTLHDLVMLLYFNLQKAIKHENYLHFTDLMRSIRVETLPRHGPRNQQGIPHMPCVDRLYNRGVTFEAEGDVGEICSLEVQFENGCLRIRTAIFRF